MSGDTPEPGVCGCGHPWSVHVERLGCLEEVRRDAVFCACLSDPPGEEGQ